jgi:molybdenum cofactor cytidylyltransferase
MQPVVHILVLAAGASSRMRGRDKLLEPVKGRPILRLVVETAVATGAPVTVALPPSATARRAALDGIPVTCVEVADATAGMSRSISGGIAAIAAYAAGDDDGVMILPADMPGFSSKVLSDLISRFRSDPDLIFRGATTDGTPGHPVIFPRGLWIELSQLTGDEGGQKVLRRHIDRVRMIPLPGNMAVLDLDTPEDWAAFQHSAASRSATPPNRRPPNP